VNSERLRIPNVGQIKLRGGRSIAGKAKCCTVKRDGNRWTASVVCDIGPAPGKRMVTNAVGIDMGLTTLATLSDGTEIENPRWTRQHEDLIAARIAYWHGSINVRRTASGRGKHCIALTSGPRMPVATICITFPNGLWVITT